MKFLIIKVLFLYFGCVDSNHYKDKTCGVVASDNPIHQHPWLALLEYYHRGRRGQLWCGGTLLTSRHILTSAHCVEIVVKSVPELTVTILSRLGGYNMSSRIDCVAGVCAEPMLRMVVDNIFVHPRFRRECRDNVSHDLAILVLEADAPYTDFIRPICLPRRTPEIPTVLYASGFGDTPIGGHPSLVKKNIRLPYHPKCPKSYNKYNLPKDGFCAGGIKNVDTCKGDSGGPVIWVKEDKGVKRAYLWGVIKGGTKRCGLKGKPGVYISVLKNLVWIKNVIETTSLKQQDNGTQSEGNENGEPNGEKWDKENQNEETANEEKPKKEITNDFNENGVKKDKEKLSDDKNYGQMRSRSSYLLVLTLVLLSLLLL